MDPFQPSNNKPGSGAWWAEMVKRFGGFLVAGFKEVLGLLTGKK